MATNTPKEVGGLKVKFHFPLYKQTIFLSAFCFSILLNSSCFAENTPSGAIKAFYQLVSKQQCKEALKIRPNYSLGRCEKITKAHIHKVTTELSDNKNAVVLLELDSFLNKKKNYFFGYVKLTKKKDKWLIMGPFKNREDYWLDEYVNAYIPEGIKGLSKAEKQKKFTPPPVTIYDNKKTPSEINENIVKPQATKKSKTTVKKNTNKVTATTEPSLPVPPGDSIDADEFKEPDSKSQQTHTKNTTTIGIATQKAITSEANKLILGEHTIEGNYTALLKAIRKNFPSEAISNIILIDQSRNTLYLYNHSNLLLAFFPILSSDNSNFPSGLYRLSNNSALPLTHQKVRNQVITLERVQNTIRIDPKLPAEQKNEQYYIRDLFDTDQSKSLLLSPIDNNKLQQLILPSTMVYKGL